MDSRLLRIRLRTEEILSHHHTTYVLVGSLIIALIVAILMGLRMLRLKEQVAGLAIQTHCINAVSAPAYSPELTAQLGDFAPDGHVSAIEVVGERRTFIPVGVRTVLVREFVTGETEVSTVFSPSGIVGSFDQDYAGITSIVRPTDNPLILLGLYHAELRSDPYNPSQYQASVGLARSEDGGLTWTRVKKLLGSTRGYDATKITGVGQPSAAIIQRNGIRYVYVYYVDWDRGEDAIHLVRAPVTATGELGDIAVFEGVSQGFVPRSSHSSHPVISPRGSQVYAALPSITHMVRSGTTVVMIYEAADGFYAARSRDGVNWTPAIRFYCFSEPSHVRRFAGQGVYESYPTLIDPITSLTQHTNPYRTQLMYGRGRPHQPYITTVDLSQLGVLGGAEE